jgi:hypothetical protein
MPESVCPHESTIVASLATGTLPEDLRLHISNCAVCSEVYSAASGLLRFAGALAEEPLPSGGSMWWRLNLKMRQERARRAQQPLVWMGRILYLAVAMMASFIVTQLPDPSRPAVAAGLLALCAVVLPVVITLWVWSRSKI